MKQKDIFIKDSDGVFLMTQEEINTIYKEKQQYENSRAVSIEALKIVQKRYGWVSDSAIKAVSKILNISISDLEEIATFYNQIYRKPVGRHIIRYCDSVVCYITGYKSIQNALEKKLDIKTGESTLDGRFTLLPASCLGNCDKSPSMMINEDTYGYLNPESTIELLDKYQ